MHHTVDMTNQEWVREHTNGASLRALGERLNLNHVTVSRRIIEGDANTCIALARAYGQDPVEWLAGWGILTADEVAAGTVAEALRSATDLQLAEQLVVGTPKSGKSRTVAVPGFVAELLAAQCVGKSMDDLVFTAPRSGEWIRRPSINTSWFRAAAEACGVVGITPHDLRHTAASLAVQSGANVKVVQAMLGHESAALTLDVYADLFDEDLDTVAAAMDAARNASLRELRVTSPDQKLITASKTV